MYLAQSTNWGHFSDRIGRSVKERFDAARSFEPIPTRFEPN